MAQSDIVDKLVSALSKVGYDTRVGPVGSFTYPTEKDNPTTLPFNWPLMPGYVGLPKSGQLGPEDVAHEGAHVTGGLPQWLMGVLGAKSLGVDKAGGYLAPDEIISYMSQPNSEATSQDMKTIQSLAANAEGNPLYRTLIEMFAGSRSK